MQYILTEQEYKNLTSKKRERISQDKQELQALCTKIAEEMPIPMSNVGGAVGLYRCIRSKTKMAPYCDDCPVKDICPNEHKQFSK